MILTVVSSPVSITQSFALASPIPVSGTSFKPWKPFVFGFSFNTLSTNATLFLSSSPSLSGVEYFALAIVNGLLTLTFDYGCGSGTVTISPALNDGLWHSVVVSRACSQAALAVDGGAYLASAVTPSAEPGASAWRSVFSVAVPGQHAALGTQTKTGVTLGACARGCIDDSLCVAFNYLAAVNATVGPRCELLARTSVTVVPVSVNYLSPYYYYYEVLQTAYTTVVAPSSSYQGCLGGVTLNSWPISLTALGNVTLSPCS